MFEKRLYKIMGKDLTDNYYSIKNENTENGYLTEAGARAILDYAKKEDHSVSQRNAIFILLYRECKKTKKYEKKKNKILKNDSV